MSLENHIAAFTNVLGSQHPDIVFGFASIDWASDDQRNQFINELITLNDNKKIGE
jgi:hypothetical protein